MPLLSPPSVGPVPLHPSMLLDSHTTLQNIASYLRLEGSCRLPCSLDLQNAREPTLHVAQVVNLLSGHARTRTADAALCAAAVAAAAAQLDRTELQHVSTLLHGLGKVGCRSVCWQHAQLACALSLLCHYPDVCKGGAQTPDRDGTFALPQHPCMALSREDAHSAISQPRHMRFRLTDHDLA